MRHLDAAQIKHQARALAAANGRDRVVATTIGEAMERRGVPLLRVILAASALLIIYLEPTEPDRNVPMTYGALVLYVLFSVAVYLAEFVWARALPARAAHWLDIAWHTLLVSLSSGTSSLFFSFYYFDILVASFRCGRAEGLRVTGATALLFTLVGYATTPVADFELNRFLMRPVTLFVIGYMIAYWGGLEERLKRRLALLEELTVLPNPRLGVHQTIATALEKLRAFYGARACLLVVADAGDDQPYWYQARLDPVEPVPNPERCPPELAALLLSPPHRVALLAGARRFGIGRAPHFVVRDVSTGLAVREVPASIPVVLAALDAPAVATVPVRLHHAAVGRLYLTASVGTFEISDLAFLSHAMSATLRVTENVRLVDRLASDAAANERHSLARSIHDTVVQPYIGLKLGLTALRQRLRTGDGAVEGDLERLLALIDPEMTRLRDYIAGLRGATDAGPTVVPAIQQFADRFAAVTGIDVTVKAPASLAIGDRLGAGLVEMVAEGLSNVRRHTLSQRAVVTLERADGVVALRIDNDGEGVAVGPFEPRSLAEHAHAFGGSLTVHRSADTTGVAIRIPL